MAKYIFKRIIVLVPTLLAIIFIIFGIMNLTPGDSAQLLLGQQATPVAISELNHNLGLDRPFLVRYGDYVLKLVQGDMGKSYTTNRSVFETIISRFPTTVTLATTAILLAILIGVPLGVVAAVKQYSIFDILGTSAAMFMASMPAFWFGLLLILLFSLKLVWLPSMGVDEWQGYILPAFTLAIPVSAELLRMTRTTMLEAIRQDYIRTARAKGQTEIKVIFQHALKNALLPVVTVAGMEFGWLLGGAVVIETVFSINGVGQLIVEAIRMKDVPQVTGCGLFLAFFFMIVMLFVDILYAYIDPRVKALYKRE